MAVFNAFVTMASLVKTVPPAKILMSVLKIQPYVKMAYASMTRYINEKKKYKVKSSKYEMHDPKKLHFIQI